MQNPSEYAPMAAPVRRWLLGVIALIVCMVAVGGITRLTGSGLSIVEWQPLMGAIPPLDAAQWQETFAKYQASPQYRLTNAGMSLDEFKQIFFWEYIHRLLGRLIGVAFFLPLVWFWSRGLVTGALRGRLVFALLLGGLQGLMGWLMVKSGLVDEPRVSHLRLAAHLGLALLIMGWLAWLVLDARPRDPAARPFPRLLAWAILGCGALQIVYGAFVAGLRAGWGFNTFPKMGDAWLPDAVFALEPWWINLLHGHAAVQFVHRWTGTLLLLLVAAAWLRARGDTATRVRAAATLLLALVIVQYGLGVYTLVNVVPIVPAVIHQAWAALLLLGMVNLLQAACAAPR